jgi:hypothetical protein
MRGGDARRADVAPPRTRMGESGKRHRAGRIRRDESGGTNPAGRIRRDESGGTNPAGRIRDTHSWRDESGTPTRGGDRSAAPGGRGGTNPGHPLVRATGPQHPVEEEAGAMPEAPASGHGLDRRGDRLRRLAGPASQDIRGRSRRSGGQSGTPTATRPGPEADVRVGPIRGADPPGWTLKDAFNAVGGCWPEDGMAVGNDSGGLRCSVLVRLRHSPR